MVTFPFQSTTMFVTVIVLLTVHLDLIVQGPLAKLLAEIFGTVDGIGDQIIYYSNRNYQMREFWLVSLATWRKYKVKKQEKIKMCAIFTNLEKMEN